MSSSSLAQPDSVKFRLDLVSCSLSCNGGRSKADWLCNCVEEVNSCCIAYLSSCHRSECDAEHRGDPHTFHCNDYFVLGGVRTYFLGVSSNPMFRWIFLNSWLLSLLLVRIHQAEMIILKHIIQECNNVTRVLVEPTSCD